MVRSGKTVEGRMGTVKGDGIPVSFFFLLYDSDFQLGMMFVCQVLANYRPR